MEKELREELCLNHTLYSNWIIYQDRAYSDKETDEAFARMEELQKAGRNVTLRLSTKDGLYRLAVSPEKEKPSASNQLDSAVRGFKDSIVPIANLPKTPNLK